jgi:amino-acid N-acetyltransferase
MDIRIERAQMADTDAVLALVAANGLPTDGLREHLTTTLVARRANAVVGSSALELYDDGALLRSVAVDPREQGHGLGRRLTDAAIDLARTAGAPNIYLLTTTAEQFFPKFGFERIARADVPAGVQTSIEFTSACPSSATVMRKSL